MKLSTIIILSTGLFFILIAQGVDIRLRGSVTPKNTLAVSNLIGSLDLNTDLSEQSIFDYSVQNNDPDGFKISFLSKNNGQMRKESGFDSENTGTFVDYTLSIQRGQNGTLGADPVVLPMNTSLSDTEPTDIKYNQGVKQGTKHASYSVLISTDSISEKDLLQGAYNDTITVVIANL
jgi:hypothetical protein